MRITKCYKNDMEKLKDIRQLLYWAKVVNKSYGNIKFTTISENKYISKYENKDKE